MSTPIDVDALYRRRYEHALSTIATKLERLLAEYVKDLPHIDRVSVRAKTPHSFLKKASSTVDGHPKYTDPMGEIQDQVGARITVFYLDDVSNVIKTIEDYFGAIEKRRVEPESHAEFSYEGFHYVLFIPDDVLPATGGDDEVPTFFELQIKTLFQHAWSEASHDLLYKPGVSLTRDQKRRGAFGAAQAWGADRVFDELAKELTQDGEPLSN